MGWTEGRLRQCFQATHSLTLKDGVKDEQCWLLH